MSSNAKGLDEAEKAIDLRKRVKSKKPDFVRQESWRYDRVDDSWRKPRGIDSKMRREVKGCPAKVKIGYRGPRKARGLHPSAYREVIVYNIGDLSRVDPKTEAIRIAHTVGAKKRNEIISKARELGIRILNAPA
ncbi:MAG: 50S ribosomal protein L32e [Candidatus Bathyarchaeia archaeon]